MTFLSAACSVDALLSAVQMERRVAAILAKPWADRSSEAPGDDAKFLRRYLERVPDGDWRLEVYERLIKMAASMRQYADLSALLDGLYREFIISSQAGQTAAYQACDLYLRHSLGNANRWEVWNRMLQICLQREVDRELGVRILEAMAEEFVDDSARLRMVLLHQAEEEEKLQRLTEAAGTLGRLLALPDTSGGEIAEYSSRLGNVRFLQRDFPAAEAALKACVERLLPGLTAIRCLHELGALYRVQEKLEEAEETMQRVLDIPGISEEVRGRVVFELADVEYQFGRYDEARRLFESIRTAYPNPLVIEVRLRMLEDRQKKKD